VREGSFRADLYYRLAVVSLEVPPLRERGDEIPLLAAAFVRKVAHREGIQAPALDPETLCRLVHYEWPGNVRELENAIERAVILSRDGVIRPTDLPDAVSPASGQVAKLCVPMGTTLREAQDLLIAQTLRVCQGDKRRAARFLGTSPRTITRRTQTFPEDPCAPRSE
jgi:two-component system response regulator HydG